MENTASNKLLVVGAGVALVAGGMIAATESWAAPSDAPVAVEEASEQGGVLLRQASTVEGVFGFTQTEVTPLETIARSFTGASQVLCGATARACTDVAPEDWTITVEGDVDNAYSVTVAELVEDPQLATTLMGCSCLGNPADGRASINAQVTGVAACVLLDRAGVVEGANTVVFTSADGYEVALPLKYVTQRFCPIVFDVNGSPIEESIGGTNQLWLGSTSANYFARDITSIRVETRENPPAEPCGPEDANLPNVGVTSSVELA